MRKIKTIWLKRVTGITPELLRENNINALILDLDNTLTTHDNPKPAEGVLEWLDVMKKEDIKLIIVSNNHEERVKPFADLLGLEFVSKGAKPLPKGINIAQKRLAVPFCSIAIVGDQIFTDILAAKIRGIKSIYVEPFEHEKTTFFKFKRRMEKLFLPRK